MIREMLNLDNGIFAIAPFVASSILFFLIVTGLWRNEKLFTGTVVFTGLCMSVFTYGYAEASFYIATSWLILGLIISIIRRNKNANNTKNTK